MRVDTPYQHRFRFNGSFELPWGGVQLAGVYQDLPGPLIAANVTYTSAQINAQPTGALGRPLRLSTRTIDVIAPFSHVRRSVSSSSTFARASCSAWAGSGSSSIWTSTTS